MLGAVELRGVLLVFVCCCSFPSIALVVTLSLLLCSRAAVTSGSHFPSSALVQLVSWCAPVMLCATQCAVAHSMHLSVDGVHCGDFKNKNVAP